MVVILQPGVAVGIQYMDTLQWTKGFGAKDVVHPDVPPDADTIFRIASITKVFVVSYHNYVCSYDITIDFVFTLCLTYHHRMCMHC